MATQPSLTKNILIKGVVGLVVGVLLAIAARTLEFPFVFQAMFFAYAMLGAVVFMLLEAPPMKPMSGAKAVVSLIVFYVLLSGLYMGGASLWPQYDPSDEKGKIDKILGPRYERYVKQRDQTDELLQRAEQLEKKVDVLMARLERAAPALARTTVLQDGEVTGGKMTLVQQGREVYDLYECYNCHKIGGKGSVKKRGPALDNIGNLLTISDIKRKIIDPTYLYAEGFEEDHKKGRMPDKYRDLMMEDELNALGAYLSTLKNPEVETPRPVFVKSKVEHGFTVYGYVRDATGKPAPGVEVMAMPLKDHGHGSKAKTNAEGYYEIFLHMHNEDAGTKVKVAAGAAEKVFVADYDPNDKVNKRQESVDLTVQS